MDRDIKNRASYIADWLAAIKKDYRLIVSAAALATKAADYIHGEKRREHEAGRDADEIGPLNDEDCQAEEHVKPLAQSAPKKAPSRSSLAR